MFYGEEIASFLFKFRYSDPVNDYWDNLGVSSMNFMENIGSLLLPILFSMVVYFFTIRFIHWVAKRNYEVDHWREIGTFLYPQHNKLVSSSTRLFLEGALDISLAICM
jgi:hypothetical protein